jgi:hypothetical protein
MKISELIWGQIGSKAKAKAPTPPQESAYEAAIARTKAMVGDRDAQAIAKKHGLQFVSISWEDTARFKGSAVGPNISDMSIQVGHDGPHGFQAHLMPVLRFPNFSDRSGDIDPSDFALLVGNHEEGNEKLRVISLREFLSEPSKYLTRPESWAGNKKVLLSPRDDKVLVASQACFLPVPKGEAATFNPVVFNYQSYEKNPAVLTILATREGTSVTVIDNARDAFEEGAAWGQRLFFNQHGERASLSATRKSEFVAPQNEAAPDAPPSQDGGGEADGGLNMVLLIQVPLKQKPGQVRAAAPMMLGCMDFDAVKCRRAAPDVEDAVIGHGEVEGPFTEIDDLDIERDDRYPIRVTVQFYKATSNGVVDEPTIAEIRAQIQKVYDQADFVGSLVTQGETGRTTEYDGLKVQPADWWQQFWARYEKTSGRTREQALDDLRKLLGSEPQEQAVSELYLRNLLKK